MLLKNKITWSLLIVLSVQILSAQEIPYSQNYTISEYKADNQNWDIFKADNGKVYAANNKGLLEFDGLNWDLWQMPNGTVVRSVMTEGDRIYVGSFEEFGFWERNAKGTLDYTSLSANLGENLPHSAEEFWQIVRYKGTVVFRSFSGVYQFSEGKVVHYELGRTVMHCDVVGEDLLISTLEGRIYKLTSNGFVEIFFFEALRDVKVISIDTTSSGELFICTALKGCFLQVKEKLIPWKSEINVLLKKQLLNRYSRLENGNQFFGTIKNGVYLTDSSGKLLYAINIENGLMNNTVLGQFIGEDNQLWLGLDNGITNIDISVPYYFYSDTTGSIGAVYDVINFKGTIYIGSNTGLFYIDAAKELQFVNESQGQVWDLQEVDGALFCGHNNGTFIVEGNTMKRVSIHTGGYVIKRIPEQKNRYLQGTYSGLVVYHKENDEWKTNHLGSRFKLLKYLAFENQYTAWAAHAYKGLYKVKLDANYEKIIDYKDYSDKGLWSSYNVKVYNFNNVIAFHTEKGWQKYEPLLDSIVGYDILNEKVGAKGYVISEDDLRLKVLKMEDVISVKSGLNTQSDIIIPNKYYKERLVSGNERISKLGDSLLALNLFNGYMLIDPSKVSTNNAVEQPYFERVSVDGTLVRLDTSEIELPFKNNNIAFRIAAPKLKNAVLQYSLISEDIDPVWSELKQGNINLSNLSYGKFSVEVRAIDEIGNVSKSAFFNFTVLPPLYKSNAARMLYLVLLSLLMAMVYLWYRKKIIKEKKSMLLAYEESQKKAMEEKAIENEKELVNVKNDSLKNEIKFKSKQLANTAMALVKKNEVLLSLKKELILNKENFSNTRSYKKLVKQIDYSIEHEDEWGIFESNFNQVHDEFFLRLKATFSTLTNKDLKLCAFIKMNLLNKEMAPLLNISVRGVETHRYRLKRKLLLEKDQNLTSFLQNFN